MTQTIQVGLVLVLFSVLFANALGKEPPAASVTPPTRSTGKLAPGSPWETDYFVIDSGQPGATVLIVGGMHGNEPAGSVAAEQIRHWPVKAGKLIVIPRANVLALEANTRLTPGFPDEESNLNRNFPPVSEKTSGEVVPRGKLAGALWRFAIKMKPDWVLDLHEGFDFHISHKPEEGGKRSVGSSIIYRGGEELDSIVAVMIDAANDSVTDPEKTFVPIPRGPVSTGLANACINVIGAKSIILETTYTDQPLSTRTRQHRAMTNILLNHVGLITENCSHRIAPTTQREQIQVAIFDGIGTGPSKFQVMDVIEDAPELSLHQIGPYEMKPEILQQFNVVVFPGGSASKQANDMGEEGRDAVRKYVESGKGIVGICAGAYLCSASYRWSLKVIDSRPFTGTVTVDGQKKNLWYRGPETGIEMELSENGKALFGNKGIENHFEVRYANGPIIIPHGEDGLDGYEVLAWFRTENSRLEPQKGNMVNTPAIISGSFGEGRVVAISPHPEKTPELHPILSQSIRWASGTID